VLLQDPFYVPKTNETPETVSKIGGEFIESLKRAKDKKYADQASMP